MNLNYDKIWKEAITPAKADLAGEFNVKVLTGVCKPLNRINENWQKVIRLDGISSNIINGEYDGFFHMVEFISKKDPDSPRLLFFNYNRSINNGVWRRLRDTVKMTEPGVFLGQIFFRVRKDKYWFLGYFSLIKKGIKIDPLTFKKKESEIEKKTPHFQGTLN